MEDDKKKQKLKRSDDPSSPKKILVRGADGTSKVLKATPEVLEQLQQKMASSEPSDSHRSGRTHRSDGSVPSTSGASLKIKAVRRASTGANPNPVSGGDEPNRSARSHRSQGSSISMDSSEELKYLKRTVPSRSGSGYMPQMLMSADSFGSDEVDVDVDRALEAADYGYEDMEDRGGPGDFRRRGSNASVSRKENDQLAEAQARGMSLDELRASFHGKKKNLKVKPGRIERRTSLASVSSQFTANSAYSGIINAANAGGESSMHGESTYSIEFGDLQGGASEVPGGDGAANESLPVPSDVVGEQQKRPSGMDQMVESLVWFSFHTPRTVLEDLITHEIDVWRKENAGKGAEAITKSPKLTQAASNKKKMKLTSKGVTPASSDDDDSGSLSSLSDDGGATNEPNEPENYDTNFSEKILRMQRKNISNAPMIKLPKAIERECALLFVDMSGFTKLSTMLDVESLSRVINSYFDMIVSEVLKYGGDILKFAGDAFFAEWKITNDAGDEGDAFAGTKTALSELNASLGASMSMNINDDDIFDDADLVPPASLCVARAAKCAMSIVEKYSDYQVTGVQGNASDAMLNVHCGIGMGHLVGLHVGDYKEDQEEEGDELRREFLILGDPIDQVAKAEELAKAGQVMISPEAVQPLSFCCGDMYFSNSKSQPVCIANKATSFLQFDEITSAALQVDSEGSFMQPYESLRMHCQSLNQTALARLHLQTALYVHPVIRADELALSAAIQAGKISQPTETVESRHRAEAELRSVFTIFISAILTPKVTGNAEVDAALYQKLADVMHITSRELDRYSGHLRQFIVDDKGVVLIATFGLRGSTFPNMVSNNGLPAVFAIHRALKQEADVENKIGATFGKVYCGVVGGIHRHEFAVMGAPVNLAARLMGSKVNSGILVDEAVRAQADGRFNFKSLPPVKAKGYDKPVPILEPIDAVKVAKKKKSTFPFTGRTEEKRVILSAANTILEDPVGAQSSMVFLMGESGMGKTALALAVMDDIRKSPFGKNKKIVTARSTSTETEQRIPLSSYRKIFLSIVHELCQEENKGHDSFNQSGVSLDLRSNSSRDLKSKSFHGKSSMHGSRHSLTRSSHRFRSSRMLDVENSDRPGLERSKGSSSRELEMSHTTLGDHSYSNSETEKTGDLDTFSQSLREISEDLAASPPKHQREQSRDQLPQSLNSMSKHGSASVKRKSEVGSSLSKSSHRMGGMSGRRDRTGSIKLGSLHGLRGSMVSHKSANTRSDDASAESGETGQFDGAGVPYFEKLVWVCEQLEYPFEYADIVGSQFLGLEGATTVTHVDGHVPTMDELVEFLALAFICLADFAEMIVLFIDDFQWVDSFSWKIFRVLCKRGKKMLMLCAMRSHDKQALRRLSTAANRQGEIQNQMIEISMVPLDFSEIQLLMATVLGYHKKAIPEALCTDVFQRTGGLPVYVVQMLENMKRKKTVELGSDGMLTWTAAGLKDKRAASSNQTGAVMEETFLSRFDGLDVRVRKVLQSCAVLGLRFALSDVIQVHPEMEEADIENALDSAVDELILIEQIEDEDEGDALSIKSDSSSKSESSPAGTADRSGTKGTFSDRFFQFSHAMWRKNVLTTMLKERKIELHRMIAESMEKNQVVILEESDISRLLTLFDHWKSCGDFSKSAPLALTVGARLEEWDLCAQSLELYEDALEMSFDSVNVADDAETEWVQVSAKPSVLDLILRLHVHVGLCYKKLGDDQESILTFEDAYKIMRTASKVPNASKGLMIPIISSLCVLQMSQPALDTQTKTKHEKLLEKFVTEAMNTRSTVHVARALCMQAVFHSRYGELDRACESIDRLRNVYNVEKHSRDMTDEYGRDYAIEALAESVQWYYLLEQHERAEDQADQVIEKYLPLIDPLDVDACMNVILPIVQVFRLTSRVDDADWLLKRYVINPAHEHASNSQFWVPLFNPLAYVIELIMMEESETFDEETILEMENWALKGSDVEYESELEKKAHTMIGEICWRLANYRDEGDPVREKLEAKAQELLKPVAHYPHGEFFLRKTAMALMEAF